MSDWRTRAQPVSDWRSRAILKSEAQPVEIEEPSLAQKALETAGKVLDYPGGLVRTGLAGASDVVAGTDVFKPGDWGRAFRGQAPTGSEILERAGMEEGAKLSDVLPIYSETGEGLALQKGGWADPSARGVAGFVAEQAVDPLNWITLGGASAAKGAVKSGTQAFGKGTEKIGQSIFSKARAMQHADRAAVEAGKKVMPSEVLLKYGKWGTGATLESDTKKLIGTLQNQAQAATKAAEEAGATVNLFDSPTIQKAMEWKLDPSPQKRKAAESFLSNLQKDYGDLKPKQASTQVTQIYDPVTGATKFQEEVTEAVGELPLSKANELKTDLYKELQGTYAKEGTPKPRTTHEDELWKGFASDIKTGIEQKASLVDEKLGQDIIQNNAEQSALRSAEKAFRREGTKSRNYQPIGAVKAGVSTVNPLAGAAMLAGDVLRANPFWSGSGLAINRLGQGISKVGATKAGLGLDAGILGIKAAKPQQQENPYSLIKR